MCDDEEKQERHKICQSCEFLKKEEYRCGICNCVLALKIPLKTSVCPKGKWSDLMNKEESDENKNMQ